MRGVDSEGHAANFVETEQITETEKARSSFVQVVKGLLYYMYCINIAMFVRSCIAMRRITTGV